MKLELPLAVLLLAAGCLLWTAQRSQKNQANSSSQLGKKAASGAVESKNADAKSPGRRGNAGKQANTASDSTSPVQSQVIPASNSQSTQLIHQSAANLFNSVPIEANVRITIDLFQQPLVANGRYYQQGQGTQKARLEFANGAGENAIKFTQLCDGRFNFSKQTIGSTQRLESLDLEKVVEASRGGANSSSANPANPLLFGNLASLMYNLAEWFDFEAPVQTELGGISMLSIKGSWKPQALKAFVNDQVDTRFLEPEIDWSEIPRQIPHTVEITIGNDHFLPLFPYRIVFRQKGDSWDAEDRRMLQLELFEVGKLKQLSDQVFNIDSEDTHPIDTTERYVQRMEHYDSMIGKSSQASKGVNATTR